MRITPTITRGGSSQPRVGSEIDGEIFSRGYNKAASLEQAQ
jgi:hypothetical protein